MATPKLASATKKVTDALKKAKSSIKKKTSPLTKKKVAAAPSELALTNDSSSSTHSYAVNTRVASSAPTIAVNEPSTLNMSSSSMTYMSHPWKPSLYSTSAYNAGRASTVSAYGMSSFSANIAAPLTGMTSTVPQLMLNAPGIVTPPRHAIVKSADAPMMFPTYGVNSNGHSFFIIPNSGQQGFLASSTSLMFSTSPMPAANDRSFGKDASGTTIGHPLQDVSLKNLHAIFFQLESGPKMSYADTEVPLLKDNNGHTVSNAKGHELRDILCLPRYIDRNFEAGLYLELFRRLDSRFEITDVFDRMDLDVFDTNKKEPSEKTTKNAWQMQRWRFRSKIHAKAWKEARKMPTKEEIKVLEHLDNAQIVANTSMVIEDGKLWQPRHHSSGRVDYVDSGLALDHFTNARPTSNPSKRMECAAALRCRLQVLARADGKGNGSDDWSKLDGEDRPYWWHDRNNKTGEDRGNGDVAANRGSDAPKYAEVVKGSERRISQIDNKKHSEWMQEIKESIKEDDIGLPPEPRKNRLPGKAATAIDSQQNIGDDEEDDFGDGGGPLEDGTGVVDEPTAGNKRRRVDDDDNEEEAGPSSANTVKATAAKKRRKIAPPYPSAAARKSLSVLNTAVAATDSPAEQEKMIVAWAKKKKPARKPRKSRAKAKATSSASPAVPQYQPAHEAMHDNNIDPRLQSMQATTTNNTVSDPHGGAGVDTDADLAGPNRNSPPSEAAAAGCVVGEAELMHSDATDTASNNASTDLVEPSNSLNEPAMPTSREEPLYSSASTQSGETRFSSLPTLSDPSSNADTSSNDSVYTPAAQQDPNLPSSVMEADLMFAGQEMMPFDDWTPEQEISSNKFSF